MLRLVLTRVVERENCTLGVLTLPDLELLTLEPRWVNNLPQQSCIPGGEYVTELEHSPRFGRLLYELKGVPGRSEIKFHAGTNHKDTHGCILVGSRFARLSGQPAILDSRAALAKMHSALAGIHEFVLRVRSI